MKLLKEALQELELLESNNKVTARVDKFALDLAANSFDGKFGLTHGSEHRLPGEADSIRCKYNQNEYTRDYENEFLVKFSLATDRIIYTETDLVEGTHQTWYCEDANEFIYQFESKHPGFEFSNLKDEEKVKINWRD